MVLPVFEKTALKKALEDNPEATPGHIIHELSQETFAGAKNQQKLLDSIFDRLKPSTSVHVLAKCLNLLKHLCENGHDDVQKVVQRKNDLLKEFAHYRGVPDTRMGDSYNQRVRDNAKAAIEAAFSPRKAKKVNIAAGQGADESGCQFGGGGSASAIPSFSIFGAGGDSRSGGGFGAGMKGGGNAGVFTRSGPTTAWGAPSHDPRIAEMPSTNAWAEHMARGATDTTHSSVVNKITSNAANVMTQARLGFGFFGHEKPQSFQDRYAVHTEGNVGNFEKIEISPLPPTATKDDEQRWGFTEEKNAQSGAAEASASATQLRTAFQQEVAKIATCKAQPQRIELATFLQRVKDIHEENELGYEELAAALDEHLAQTQPWTVRLHALMLLEHCLRSDLSPEIADYYRENPEDVQRNVQVVQASLRDRALKVLKLLGLPAVAPKAATSSSPSSTRAAASSGNLFDNLQVMSSKTNESEERFGSKASEETPLFGGLAVKNPTWGPLRGEASEQTEEKQQAVESGAVKPRRGGVEKTSKTGPLKTRAKHQLTPVTSNDWNTTEDAEGWEQTTFPTTTSETAPGAAPSGPKAAAPSAESKAMLDALAQQLAALKAAVNPEDPTTRAAIEALSAQHDQLKKMLGVA